MNAKRTHYLLLGLLLAFLLAIPAGAYQLQAFLAKKADVLAGLKGQTQSLQQQEQGLKKAKQDIAKYADLQKITQQIVPQDKDQAEAILQIVNIAANAGVSLTTISFPASTLGGSATSKTPAASTASPSAAASSKSALSQLTPVPNIPGVYQLAITIQDDSTTEVSYQQFYNFLSGLENNRRTAEVSSITISPDVKDRNFLTFALTLNEYIKPAS